MKYVVIAVFVDFLLLKLIILTRICCEGPAGGEPSPPFTCVLLVSHVIAITESSTINSRAFLWNSRVICGSNVAYRGYL